jgi:hypothetical protein
LGELMDRPGGEEIRRLRRYATERGLACLDDQPVHQAGRLATIR